MARLIPSFYPEDTSFSEKQVFNELRHNSPYDWIVLHSLWMRTHNTKLLSETDFVVITDKCILILEVKGGTLERQEDGWYVQKKDNNSREYIEEPFKQAKGSFFALDNFFKESGNKDLRKYLWGFGIVFPNCSIDICADPMDYKNLSIDKRKFKEQLRGFILELEKYWYKEQNRLFAECEERGLPGFKKNNFGDEDTRKRVVNVLRPKFERIIGLSDYMTDVHEKQLLLTEEQKSFLDNFDSNPRIRLEGTAGTGKTLLAVEIATRQLCMNNRVLFVCFNKMLAKYIRKLNVTSENEKCFDVFSYQELVEHLFKQANIKVELPKDWIDFRSAFQEVIKKSNLEYPSTEKYDYLVVDEAQDLMTMDLFEIFHKLLKNGIEDGRWTICYDKYQDVFKNRGDILYDNLSGVSVSNTLSVNCRNTKQIKESIKLLTGMGADKEGKIIEGPDVEILLYRKRRPFQKRLRKDVEKAINAMEKIGRPTNQIAILFSDDELLDIGVEILANKDTYFSKPLTTDIINAKNDEMLFATARSFKGLEATAIFYIGKDDLSDYGKRLIYVGSSRAKSVLRVYLPYGLKDKLTCQYKVI